MVHKIKLAHNLNKNVSRIFIVTLTHQVKVNSFVVTIGISGRLRVSRPILMEFIDNINNIGMMVKVSVCIGIKSQIIQVYKEKVCQRVPDKGSQ